MSALITQEQTLLTLHPRLILTYETTRSIRTTVNAPLPGERTIVRLLPAGPRTGTLQYFFLTQEAALLCERMHAIDGTLRIDDPDRFGTMRYVPQGTLDVRLDETTRKRFTVSVGFQELEPAA